MSIYDHPRQTMSDSIAQDVSARLPGGSSAPRTEYRPSSGHRVLPARVTAHRRSVEVGAATGPAMARDAEAALLADAGRSLYLKHRAHGIAVGSHCWAADNYAGYLGWDARLVGPQQALRHVFGV
jgi:hypothetical protein